MKNISLIPLLLIVAACNNNADHTKKPAVHADSNSISVNNDTVFANTDSIEVYFYKDPARQKEFTKLFVTDKALISVLVGNLDHQSVEMKECPHDGKMFFYRSGSVFKTVYISTADTCRYLAYTINATPHFVLISDSAYSLIHNFKLQAH
jgi:hypothetical protein